MFFDNTQNRDVVDEAILKIRDQAFVFDYSTLLKNSQNEYQEESRYFIPICMSIISISLIGMISITALTTYENVFFSILYLCGGKKAGLKYICLGYLGIISVVSFSLCTLLNAFLTYSGVYKKIMFDLSLLNVMSTVISIIILIVFSMLIPITLIRKLSVSEFIHSSRN